MWLGTENYISNLILLMLSLTFPPIHFLFYLTHIISDFQEINFLLSSALLLNFETFA